MAALPDKHPVDPGDTTAGTETDSGQDSEVRNLYSIPRPAPPDLDDVEEDGALDRLLGQFHPPQFWSEATPSPAEELNRAQYGRHLQCTGPMRRAAVIYAAIAGAWNTKDKAKIWVRSHPARLAVAVVILGLLLASPARPIVAWVLFGLPHLAFEGLTH